MSVVYLTVVFKYNIIFNFKNCYEITIYDCFTCFNDSHKLDEFVPDHVLTSGKLIRLKS